MEQFIIPHAADVLQRSAHGRKLTGHEVKLPRLGQGMEAGRSQVAQVAR